MEGRGLSIAELPYGRRTVALELPAAVEVDWILPAAALADRSDDRDHGPHDRIAAALAHPIGTPPLRELARGRRDAVILISDGSRLSPSPLFLPQLLSELNAGGIPDSRIAIVVALGMHRRHTEDELRTLAGEEAYRRVKVCNHSAREEDCIRAGDTSRGTPVWINRRVAEAELRIATGNLEPHRLAGVSGGLKALVPGVAAHATIEANHSLSRQFPGTPGDPGSVVRADLEEAQAFVPIHFLFNVIASPAREVLDVYCGDPIAAHRAATNKVHDSFLVRASRRYPLVIASAGGHPKDTQLYQAVKTLQNASELAAPGGAVVLVAECGEHYGNGLFQYWVETGGSRADQVAKLKQAFTLGPHKIEHLDKVLQQHEVYLYSAMPKEMVELTGMKPLDELSEALPDLIARCGGGPIAVLPHGALTFPLVPDPGTSASTDSNDPIVSDRSTDSTLSTSPNERSSSHVLEPLAP